MRKSKIKIVRGQNNSQRQLITITNIIAIVNSGIKNIEENIVDKETSHRQNDITQGQKLYILEWLVDILLCGRRL